MITASPNRSVRTTTGGAARRPRVGMHIPGSGSSGPWRYVDAILRGFDPAEFEVVVFSDLPRAFCEPRPTVRNVPLTSDQGSSAQGAFGKVQQRARDRSAFVGTRAKRAVPPFARLWAGYAREARQLAETFRCHGIDLLHTNATGCEEAPLAARWAGIGRVLGTFHVDSTYDLQGRRGGVAHRMLEFVSNHSLHCAIGVSAETSRDWVRRTHLSPDRVVTIHNGIDPRQFARRTDRRTARRKLGLPDDEGLVVGGVGRLEDAKGFEYLIGALSRLASTHPDVMLVLAGQGVAREQLAARAGQLGISDRVRFLGYCPDVQVVFDALDIFAMPSLCEALPYALLEAMATGLTAVGATVGGIPEVIVQGTTGLLVPPRNEVALAAALKALIDSSDLRSRMGAAARERVEKHFTEAEMVSKTLDLYRAVLADGRKRVAA